MFDCVHIYSHAHVYEWMHRNSQVHAVFMFVCAHLCVTGCCFSHLLSCTASHLSQLSRQCQSSICENSKHTDSHFLCDKWLPLILDKRGVQTHTHKNMVCLLTHTHTHSLFSSHYSNRSMATPERGWVIVVFLVFLQHWLRLLFSFNSAHHHCTRRYQRCMLLMKGHLGF